MSSWGRRAVPTAALAAGLALALIVMAPMAGAAKGKKKGGGFGPRTFSSDVVNQVVPDDPGVNAVGALQVPLNVAGKFRGTQIADVNASIRVTDANVADLQALLTAPNGATTELVTFTDGVGWGGGSPDCNGAFLTLDDETPIELGVSASSSPSFQKLYSPYAGVAEPDGFSVPLAVMDRGPIRGAWTLTLRDTVPGQMPATINCWQVQVQPKATKKGKGR